MNYRGSTLPEMTVRPTATLADVVAALERTSTGIVLVTGEDGRLQRTITDGDVRRAMIASLPSTTPVEALPKGRSGRTDGSPITAPSHSIKVELLHLMKSRKIRHVPLVDLDGRPVDLVMLSDLIEEVEPPLQAVVMAGGFGTRLRPLTESIPKPLLPVGDKPIIEYIIRQMQLSGIRQVNVTTHYLADKIKSHLGDGRDFGVDINYVTENQPLGTAGALSLIGHPRKTTLVMNGDILTRVDFRAMYDFHTENDAELTVAVCPYEVKIPYGVVQTTGNLVADLQEKPIISYLVNAGIYLLEDTVYSLIPKDQTCHMTTLIDKLIAAGRNVAAFPIHEYWLDIGQHADYLRAQEDARYGRLL